MDMTDDLLTPQALVVAKDSDDIKELLAALDSWGFKTSGPKMVRRAITSWTVRR